MLKYLILMMLVVMPTVCNASQPTKSDMYWLTQNIYQESRNQSLYGQFLVGFVTLERLDDGRWGNSIKEVVTSKKQFSWHNNKKIYHLPTDEKAWNSCKSVALASVIVHEYIRGTGIIFYHDKKVNPKWNRSMYKMVVLGEHIFYREKGL